MGSASVEPVGYAIGGAEPVAVHLEVGGGQDLDLDEAAATRLLTALRPRAIIERLALTEASFLPTAAFGHFGRPAAAWEQAAADVLLGELRSLPLAPPAPKLPRGSQPAKCPS